MESEHVNGTVEHVRNASPPEPEHKEDSKIHEDSSSEHVNGTVEHVKSTSPPEAEHEEDNKRHVDSSSDHVNGTVEHVRNTSPPEPEHEEDDKIHVDLSSASSSSSSSPRSLLDLDFHSTNPFNDSKSDGEHLLGQESISSIDSTIQTSQWSMTSSSPPVDHLVQMMSPQVQTMGHPKGYDPNRIPSSVFASKPANASEWSTTSNESLFSIHMGNNSFSRDVMWKSGELSKLDEWDRSHSFSAYESKPNEMSSGLSAGLPPVLEVSANEENDAKMSNASSRVDSNNSLKIAPEVPKMTVDTSNMSRLSDESSRSSSSFAFPVLVSEGGKTSSLKRVDEKEEAELQTAESKPAQKSSNWRWFSWFSCLPRCC